MTSRAHLSISEVMSLLKDDFPDLTITKIRYLESQGLIAPERTASGYRKFYDSDIERLRWVLRQQRENFLPLKVIKRRLDRIDGKAEEAEDEDEEPTQATFDLAKDAGTDEPPPVWMVDHAKASQSKHTSRTSRRQSADAARDTGAREGAEGQIAVAEKPDTANRSGEPKSDPAYQEAEPVTSASEHPESARPHPKAGGGSNNAEARPPQVENSPTDPPPGGETSDVSMTRDELLHATGLTESQLSQLESFGILEPREGIDAELYGATALICARQAGTLLDAGIEARHLRAYKVAADREAGLFEQLLLPLLRQRNPAARAEAMKTLERVVDAGAAVHSALLRQSLQGLLRSGR